MVFPRFCIRKFPINRISAQRFNFKRTLLFHQGCLLLQLRAWHTQLGLMKNWNGSESTRGSWYHQTFLSLTSPDKPVTFSISDPGSVLPSWHLAFQWDALLKKNDKKIKLEAFISVSLKITEIEVSFHPLQRASGIQEFQGKRHFMKHVQRCHSAPGYSSALTEAGEPLQKLTQAEGLQQWHFWQHLPLGELQKGEIQRSAGRSDLILTFTPLHLSSRSPFKEYFKQSSQIFCCASDVFWEMMYFGIWVFSSSKFLYRTSWSMNQYCFSFP